MRKMIIRYVAGVGVFALAGLAIPLAAQAEQVRNVAVARNSTDAEVRTQADETLKQRVQGKLDDAKKRVCQNRSDGIKRIMQHAAEAGQRNLDVFTKIATKVEEFYTNKKLSVSNYDALVAAVNAKKEAANAAVSAVKAGVSFNCDTDPVGTVDAFKAKVEAMRQALKDYRTAIVNLIVAVKTAAGAAEGGQQ